MNSARKFRHLYAKNIPHTITNLIQNDQRPNHKCKLQNFWEKSGENLYDPGLGKAFTNMTPKV